MKAIVVAKGPTAKRLRKEDYTDAYLVAINQACKLIDKPDYVFMNDIESLKGLSSEDIKEVGCFVIPEFPHQNERATVNITKTNFIDKLKNLNFTGKIETFNLHTGPVKKDGLLTTIPECRTTSHTAIYYLSKIYGVKQFETYGFLIQNQYGYQNEQFYKDTDHYTVEQIKRIYEKSYIVNLKSLNSIETILNLNISRF